MTTNNACGPTEFSERDILNAMKRIPGYIDITPADFKLIYESAFQSAVERLSSSLRSQDIMHREVITLSPGDSLAEAAAALNRHKISGAPVVDDDGAVVGVVSQKDFLSLMGVGHADTFMAVVAKCILAKGCPVIPARKQTVADLMSSPPITIDKRSTLQEISSVMAKKKISRIPVTDSTNHIIGIVTRTILMNAYCTIKV